MSQTQEVADNPSFWDFSLRTYRRPGVAEACLALQDDGGADVNLVLFLLWRASRQIALSDVDVAGIEARIRPWREMTVVPLRAVRRALKSPPALVAAGEAEAFRSRIKAVELEAERLQQAAMERLAEDARGVGAPAPSAVAAAERSLAAYQRLRGAAFPEGALNTLRETLASC